MTNMRKNGKSLGAVSAVVLSLGILVGCEVTNPGPVEDAFLALPLSQQGLVNGSKRFMAELIGIGSYRASLLAREIFPGGQTGSSGSTGSLQGGYVQPGSSIGYNEAIGARFVAETAIARFTEAGAPANMMYQAHLWAGYAYRVMGEWYCEAVIVSTDPLSTEPGTHELNTDTYFDRAITNFTAALGFAATDDERYAALAGRAAAYVWLENWGNAATDAAAVPDDFMLQIEMDDTDNELYNNLYEAVGGTFRSYTQTHTFFDSYYTTTGDPRTRWGFHPNFTTTTASLQGYANNPVEFKRQEKYTSRADAQNLATGWEMRLIEAEAALASSGVGGIATAMGLINDVRTRNISDLDDVTPLAAVTTADYNADPLTGAWYALKRERYVELWLEGRRMGDERRWMANSTPGGMDTPNFEAQSTLFSEKPRSFCFDIPDSERDRNPNVPAAAIG